MGHIAAIRGHGPTASYRKGLVDGARIWWIAPTYVTLINSQVWEQVKRSLDGNWKSKSEVHREIYLPNGGSIGVRSADNPDSLRGPGLDGVVIDEAAFLKQEVWDNAIRPALADQNGWAIMQSTPNGKNWFYRRHESASSRDDWNAWTLPTSENPLVSDRELQMIKEDIGPRRFAQEHEAQFLEIEGALWPSSYFDDTILIDDMPDKFELSAIGVDPARSKSSTADYSACVFAGLSGKTLWIDAIIQRMTPGELVEAIARLHDRYMPMAIGIESVAFQSLFCNIMDSWCESNRRPPLPVVPIIDNTPKDARIQRLDPYLSSDKCRFRRQGQGTRELIEELMMFPSKQAHDDGPDAMEMAIRMLNKIAAHQDSPLDEFDIVEV